MRFFLKVLYRFYRKEFKKINKEPLCYKKIKKISKESMYTYSELKKIWFDKRVFHYNIGVYTRGKAFDDNSIAYYCRNYTFHINENRVLSKIVNHICVEKDAYTTFLNAWKIYIKDKNDMTKDRFIRVKYQTPTTDYIQDKKDREYRDKVYKELIGDTNEG